MAKPISTACPCQSGQSYSACCQPYHQGKAAPTAEALMRSRYTAYTLKLEDYLLQTWHADTRPIALDLANGTATKWLGLKVNRAEMQSETTATVEFIARFKVHGKAERMHEISRFVLIEGRWYYLDGDVS